MAKDTEKLIRQLSLISFLMAERRPVSALEIRQDVEGYAQMTSDEAFNRRFYADRAELSSLGIDLKIEKQSEGSYEAETYTLPPANFYLPSIEFSDQELSGLRTALTLLDGEFAYAEPLRMALQQLSWGKPSPLSAPEQQSVKLAMTAGSGGRELSQRLSKVETAIFRRKTILFEYYTLGRDDQGKRKVDPTTCCSAAASSTWWATRTSATTSACSGSRACAGRWATAPRPSTTSSAPTTSTRAPTPPAPTGSWATSRRWPRCGSPTASTGSRAGTSAQTSAPSSPPTTDRCSPPATATHAS